MIAHNIPSINQPITNVILHARQSQDSIGSIAINNFYTNLNEYTNKPYTEIDDAQRGSMTIIAVPDVDTDWHALSSVVIW